MKFISRLIPVALLVVTIFISGTGCKKPSKSNSDTGATITDDNGGYASDYARMENISEDILSLTTVAYNAVQSKVFAGPAAISGCDTIGLDTNVIPHKLTIDFGSSNCQCADGKSRRGRIIVYFTQFFKDSGSIHLVHYSNYYINNQSFNGVDSMVNLGLDTAGKTYYNVVSNDSLQLAGGGAIKWTSSRLVHWNQGANTAARNDDAFKVTGMANMIRANGHSYTTASLSPLLIFLDCDWIEQGSLSATPVAPTSGTARIVDYGDGPGCDNYASYTIGTTVNTITLQ